MGSSIAPIAGAALGIGAMIATGGTAAVPLLLAGSAGAGAASSIVGGYQENAADKYKAGIAGIDASIARQNAGFAGAEGEVNAGQKGEQNRQEVGKELAEQGASGLDVNKGSSVDVRASTSERGMLDAMTIRSNAARQAYGFQTQAVGDEAQAQIDRAEGKQAKTAGYVKAATILGSAAASGAQAGAFSGLGSVDTGVDSARVQGVPSYSYGVTS